MLTVIIASTGRPESLARTLQSLAKCQVPDCLWKVLVVVNGGDHASLQKAETFASILPMRVFFLGDYGKNRAINSVLDQIESGLVLFTDDDIKFDERWLVSWSRYISVSNSKLIFSGVIELEMENEIKEQIEFLDLSEDFLFSKTSARDNGPHSAELCWGGNLAISADIFKQGHRFNEKIGPDGTSKYPMGSEVEFCMRMEKLGYQCNYASEPTVFHCVRPEQLTDTSISNRYFRAGRSAFLCRKRDLNSNPIPWDIMKGLFFLKLRWITNLWKSNDRQERSRKNSYAFLKGQIYEYFSFLIPSR